MLVTGVLSTITETSSRPPPRSAGFVIGVASISPLGFGSMSVSSKVT